MSIRAGVIGIIRRFHRFVSDNAVKNPYYEIQTIGHRGAKRDVSLADGKVSVTSRSDRLGVEGIGIGAGPQIHPVTSSPLGLIQRFFDSYLDDVQVKTVRFA